MAGAKRRFELCSITQRMVAFGLICSLLPLAIIILVSTAIVSKSIERAEFQKISEIAREARRQVAAKMAEAQNNLNYLASNPVINNPNLTDEERKIEMDRLVNSYGLFTDISLYAPNRLMRISTVPEHPPALEQTRWFDEARAGKKVMSPPVPFTGSEGHMLITVYVPVPIEGRELPDVLAARFSFDDVWQLLDGLEIGSEGEAMLLDEHRNILSVRDKQRILEKFGGGATGEEEFWSSNPTGVYTSQLGVRYIYASHILPPGETRVGQTWTLLASVPYSEVLDAVDSARNSQYVVALLTICLAVGLGLIIAIPMVRSLVSASDAAGEVAKGNMTVRIPVEGSSEMKLLSTAFNKMVEEVSCHREELESLVDIRTRKLRESQGKLEETSAQLRAAFESTREAILIVRHDGVVITANRRIKDYFGLSNQKMTWAKFDVVRESFFDCFADRAGFEKSWEQATSDADFTCDGEWEIVGPEPRVVFGYTVPVRNQAGEAFAHLWTFEDITRERELQRGLEQAQKMEAIGRLAGGVAHDFNNLLTGIIGNLSLVEMAAGSALKKSGANKYIVTAKQAGERAADLVKQLLGFSRKSHLTLEHCDVNGIVAEVSELLKHTLDPRISIESETEGGLWGVRVDPTQVQQVVMNMCVNAKDAMEESGTIRLHTENVNVGQAEASKHDALPGDYVKLCVADDGQGIPPAILDKVFEPFFTTKEPGKGTGLGLATCYGIVQQHGGWIECESEVGSGTTFSIFLPRRELDLVEEGSLATPPVEQPPVGGSESILLVDDDVVVRGVAECVLKHHGYNVVCASDGREAVESVREMGEQFSLVLLDLTMPNISGKDAFKMIKEMYPDMKVLFCSGYLLTYEEFEQDGGCRPDGFVQKPYDVAKLASAVRNVIDEGVAPLANCSPVQV